MWCGYLLSVGIFVMICRPGFGDNCNKCDCVDVPVTVGQANEGDTVTTLTCDCDNIALENATDYLTLTDKSLTLKVHPDEIPTAELRVNISQTKNNGGGTYCTMKVILATNIYSTVTTDTALTTAPVTAGASSTGIPHTSDPVTSDESSSEESTSHESSSEESTSHESSSEESTSHESSSEESTSHESSSEESTSHESSSEESTSHKSSSEDSTGHESSSEESTSLESSSEESTGHESTDWPTSDSSTADQSTTDQPNIRQTSQSRENTSATTQSTAQTIRNAKENLDSIKQRNVTPEVVKRAFRGLRDLSLNLATSGRNLTSGEIISVAETFLNTISVMLDEKFRKNFDQADLAHDSVPREMEQFLDSLLLVTGVSAPLEFSTENTVTIAQSFNTTAHPIHVSLTSSSNSSSSVGFPPNYVSRLSGLGVAVTQYTGSLLGRALRNNLSMVSDIVSVVTNPASPAQLQQPVEIIIPIQNTDDEEGRQFHCTFLDFQTSRWSGAGCEVHGRNSSHLSCHCYHLTNFAILMQVVDVKISGDAYRGLETLTIIGSSVSLVAIGATLVILVWLKYFSDRLLIMINLMIALGLAQTVFLTGVNATYNLVLCRTVAVLLHYLYMSVFTLMLAEGIQLYQKLYRAMSDNLKAGHLLIASWSTPVVIVGISLAIRTEDYGTTSSCWLSMNHGTIWAFVGPALFVIFVNAVILGLVLKVYVSVRINAKKSQIAKIRSSIKAALVLLPLIGLTWLFGVLTVSSSTIVFQYLFALLNSLQGFFIFVFHVVLNADVRSSLKQKKEKLSKSRTWLTSSSSSSKAYSAKKNAIAPTVISVGDAIPLTHSTPQ